MEKFKFVLDYKIKELKKQIEPREADIKAMKEQIQEVSEKPLTSWVSCTCYAVDCTTYAFECRWKVN